MRRAIVSLALGLAILLTSAPSARAQGFGDYDSSINPLDEIVIAFYASAFGYVEHVAGEWPTVYTSLASAYFHLYSGITVENDVLRADFSAAKTSLANAAVSIYFGRYRVEGYLPPGVTATNAPMIDQAAFARALSNVANQPGYLADHGSSALFAWYALWFILYAYEDLTELEQALNDAPA